MVSEGLKWAKMKSDFYVSNMGRYLFWIWLGLGEYWQLNFTTESLKEEKVVDNGGPVCVIRGVYQPICFRVCYL